MLGLMKEYQQTLSDKSVLNETITFLEHTSVIVALFNDEVPVVSLGDERITNLTKALDYFVQWENEVSTQGGPAKNKSRQLMTAECREDLKCMILGVIEISDRLIKEEGCSINMSRLNSDVVENIFCQQRTLYNGANKNPNYFQYSYTINTIVLCQTTIINKATKNNSGKRHSCSPYYMKGKKIPLRRRTYP